MRTLLLRTSLLVALLIPLVSMGRQDPPTWTGQLAMRGHEPFTYLALTDRQGRQWTLKGPAIQDLKQGQGRWARVSGRLLDEKTIEVETWAWAPEEEPSS